MAISEVIQCSARGSKLFSMETSRGEFQYNITADCRSNA